MELLLVENYSQYPALLMWNIIGIAISDCLTNEALNIEISTIKISSKQLNTEIVEIV